MGISKDVRVGRCSQQNTHLERAKVQHGQRTLRKKGAELARQRKTERWERCGTSWGWGEIGMNQEESQR